MAVTRKDIRWGIREKLSSFPEATKISGALTDTAVSGAVTDAVLQDAALIECLDSGGEIMQVRTFTKQTGTITSLVRGVRNSVAVAHLDQAPCQVLPKWGWTDAHINRAVNKGITWLRDGMVWTLVPKANTLLAGFKDFAAPSGCVYPTGDIVKRIEAIPPGSDTYREILGWRHVGDRIFLNEKLKSDLQVRVWVQQAQAVLADDTTQIDQDKVQECVELYCTSRLLEELLANRSRYNDYSASLNDRASTPQDLQQTAYYYKNQADILRDQISRPGLAGFAAVIKP